MKVHPRVECRLPSETQEDPVGLLALYDLLQKISLNRHRVDPVDEAFVRLYCGNVGIDEDYPYSFFLEGLDSLRPRIVEFARLPYLYGS